MAAFSESLIGPYLLQAAAQIYLGKYDIFWDGSPVAAQRGVQLCGE